VVSEEAFKGGSKGSRRLNIRQRCRRGGSTLLGLRLRRGSSHCVTAPEEQGERQEGGDSSAQSARDLRSHEVGL
jgi:hypothetical protein